MESVIGHITVYKFGTKYTPVQTRKTRFVVHANRKLHCDRPALISKIHHLLAIHRQETQGSHKRLRIYEPDSLHGLNSDGYPVISREEGCHNIHREIKLAIRQCYEEQINESQLYPVGELFMELFQCQQSKKSLFSPLFDYSATCKTHKGISSLYPFSDRQNIYATFEYFMHHICYARQHLCQTGKDIINQEIEEDSGTLPLSAALQKRDSSLVLILLRYGADPFKTLENFEEHMRNPTEQILDDLNGLFLFRNTAFSAQVCAELAAEEGKARECLMLIRRAVPCIQLDCSTFIRTSSQNDSESENNDSESLPVRHVTKYSVLPKLAQTIDMDLFKAPSNLKHLCRCAVRNRIGNNWQKVSSIPKGIQSLPLPRRMKEYLDLLSD
ncbi:uncharacterized protein LOC127845273 [Dreissena polymorpha]|uniref:SOCS box domain-containing protein n=1 Tax=Dreissena polymorpha TaxID=45954 RepID=A0A9D4E0B4_DREPO|nr:uncharacterized protein LOC127845273 [Dreissena polymorpha]KAH3769664.1 hypothetical protein DPMN_170938 [Dreissena polymorpha]